MCVGSDAPLKFTSRRKPLCFCTLRTYTTMNEARKHYKIFGA